MVALPGTDGETETQGIDDLGKRWGDVSCFACCARSGNLYVVCSLCGWNTQGIDDLGRVGGWVGGLPKR